MNFIKTTAIVMVVAGLLGLLYGGINYSRETQSVEIGSLELTTREHRSVRFPIWLGIGFVVIGAGVFVFGSNVHPDD